MEKRKSRIKKPIYTVRNTLRPQHKWSEKDPHQSKFYEENYIAIWVVIIFVIVPLLIYARGFYSEKVNSHNVPVSAIAPAQMERLNQKYPQGYKLLEISGGKVVPLKADTFPGSFQVNWPQAKTTLQDGGNEIGINLPDIYYEPANIIFMTVNAVIPRRVGEIFSLYKNNSKEITIEIIEDSGEKTLCALAVRDNIVNY